MRKNFVILLFVFIAEDVIVAQNNRIPQEDKPTYDEFVNARINKLGETLSKLAKNKDNEEYFQFGRDSVLSGMFFEPSCPIFHQFPGFSTTQAYPYPKFVDEFKKYDKVELKWIDIYRDTTVLGMPVCRDPDNNCENWIYNARELNVVEYFSTKKKNLNSDSQRAAYVRYDREFPKSLLFVFYTVNGKWEMGFSQIKSLIGKLPNPKGDVDGDGVSNKEDECPTVPGIKEKRGCAVDYEFPEDDWVDNNEKEPINKIGLKPLVPAWGDYRIRGNSSPHWIWAAGIGGSLGLGGYYYFKCDQLFPGCRLPDQYAGTDFSEYRRAKLYKQNAILFTAIGGGLWVADILETYVSTGMKRNSSSLSHARMGIGIEASAGIAVKFKLSIK